MAWPVRASVRACLLCCAFLPFVLSLTTLGKEYVCQDPDTGTLHEINTTWRSTTFCGNYTCKIRRINTNQQPSKVFVSLFNPQAKVSSKDKVSRVSGFGLSKILPELAKDNDRLLNKAEIQKITELLHSVKKSDLQAVIELYNVAQEMYKDMKVSEMKAGIRSSEETFEDSLETNKLKNSYWYMPGNEHRKVGDMNAEGSEYKGKAIYPAPSYSYPPPYFYSRSLTNYPNYFTGAVLNNDLGKTGYANSQLNQRALPAYYAQRSAYDVSGAKERIPCNPCAGTYQYQMPVLASYPQSQSNIYPNPLSYNYTAQNYNNYYNYYKGNPWAFYDSYKNLSYPKAESTADEKNVVNEEKSWKTDPLSDEIINDIRANIAQRGKLLNIPLKKRLKLERVAKVIKLNQSNRKTRATSNEKEREDKLLGQDIVTKEDRKGPLSSQEIISKENNEEKNLSIKSLAKENIQEKLLVNETVKNLNIKDNNSSGEKKISSQEAVMKVDVGDIHATQDRVTDVNSKDKATNQETVMNTNSENNVSSQEAETKLDIGDKLASQATITDVNSKDKATSLQTVMKANSEEKVFNQEAKTRVDSEDKLASQDTITGVNSKDKATSLQTVMKANSEEKVLSQEAKPKVDIEDKLASQDTVTIVNSIDKVSSQKTDVPHSQENNGVLETYVEMVTCQPTAELGYFKFGNLTQPYPDCCPQKIEDKER